MPSIVSYRKHIAALITRELLLPEDPATRQRLGTELATIDGVTFVALPDGVALPENQAGEIASSIATVTLTDALRSAIKAASPHVRLINDRVREAIADRYSMADEIKLLRTAPSAECIAYNAYAEECRDWGRSEKAKLGLA